MPVNYVDTMASAKQTVLMDLALNPVGLQLFVGAGSIRVLVPGESASRDLGFPATDHTVTVDGTHATWVLGYIARDTATDEILLLVDEFLDDGVDLKYRFDDGSYDRLFDLFFGKVAAGETDLTNTTWQVTRVLERPTNTGGEEGAE